MDSEADRISHKYEGAYSFNSVACQYADVLQALLADAALGVVRAGPEACIVFGHDFRDRGVAEATIDRVRGCLAALSAHLAIREMGFGLSLDSRTWALLIDADGEDDCNNAWTPLWRAVWKHDPGLGAIEAMLAVARRADLGNPFLDDDEDEEDEDVPGVVPGFMLN